MSGRAGATVAFSAAVVLSAALPPSVGAQTCTAPRDTAYDVDSWVEPFALPAVVAWTIPLIHGLAYDSLTLDSTSGLSVDGVLRRWPATSQVEQWKHLPYPGARVRLRVRAEGEWTRIEVAMRLLCRPAFAPPASWPSGTDVVAFVTQHTMAELGGPLLSHFHQARGEVRGRSCAALNDGDRKVRICRQIAGDRPDDADAQLQYALALIRWTPGRARSQTQRAMALAGERCGPRIDVGRALADVGLLQDAAVYLERGTSLCPDSGAAQASLGLVLALAERRREARSPLERAIQLGSEDPDVFREAALTLVEAGDFAQANADFERALQLYRHSLREHPRRGWTWAAMGQCAAQLGRYAEAVPYFERARLLSPLLVERNEMFAGAYQRSVAEAGPWPAAPLP